MSSSPKPTDSTSTPATVTELWSVETSGDRSKYIHSAYFVRRREAGNYVGLKLIAQNHDETLTGFIMERNLSEFNFKDGFDEKFTISFDDDRTDRPKEFSVKVVKEVRLSVVGSKGR